MVAHGQGRDRAAPRASAPRPLHRSGRPRRGRQRPGWTPRTRRPTSRRRPSPAGPSRGPPRGPLPRPGGCRTAAGSTGSGAPPPATHAAHIPKVHFPSALHQWSVSVGRQQQAHSIRFFFTMGGPKGNGPMDAPDDPWRTPLLPGGLHGPPRLSRGLPARPRAFQAWFYDASALARWVGPSEGMVSLHCDWCHDFTQGHSDRQRPSRGSCSTGPSSSTAGGQTARGSFGAPSARWDAGVLLDRSAIVEGPVSFSHRGLSVDEGVAIERCYREDEAGGAHAIVYFGTGQRGVRMVRVPSTSWALPQHRGSSTTEAKRQ